VWQEIAAFEVPLSPFSLKMLEDLASYEKQNQPIVGIFG